MAARIFACFAPARETGVEAHDVWFCGDHPQKDVEGAAGAGLYPVWYDNDTPPAMISADRETFRRDATISTSGTGTNGSVSWN